MKHRYMNNTPMIDLFLTMALFFFTIAVIEMALIKIENKKKNIEAKAEFIITVEWDNKSEDDVDTYLEDPAGNLINFQQKAMGLMHLDRDDLGYANDKIVLPDGRTVNYPFNREIVTLRGYVPGEYTLNIHLFSQRGRNSVPVTVTIEKINPYSIVLVKKVILEYNGQEITVTRFTIDKNGQITGLNDLPKQFVGVRR